MKIQVLTTARVDAEARRASQWWRANRGAAPHLFEEELAGAIALLSEHPEAGKKVRHPGLDGLRIFVLRRTRFHLYYEYNVASVTVTIRAIWSAVRGAPPRL